MQELPQSKFLRPERNPNLDNTRCFERGSSRSISLGHVERVELVPFEEEICPVHGDGDAKVEPRRRVAQYRYREKRDREMYRYEVVPLIRWRRDQVDVHRIRLIDDAPRQAMLPTSPTVY